MSDEEKVDGRDCRGMGLVCRSVGRRERKKARRGVFLFLSWSKIVLFFSVGTTFFFSSFGWPPPIHYEFYEASDFPYDDRL
jgi:hypothetical protein